LSRDSRAHSSAPLDARGREVVEKGLGELLKLTKNMEFRPLGSERYPLPVSLVVYGSEVEPGKAREDVESRLDSDPVSALLPGLVLLELYESNQPDTAMRVPDDRSFLGVAFDSKRMNGWMAYVGSAGRKETEAAVKQKWQFKAIAGPRPTAGLYALVNMLCRYAFVYGRMPFGDSHVLGHFLEDFGQGVIVVGGDAGNAGLALSLAAMRLGVPAVVPPEYPFTLGRWVKAGTPREVAEAVVAFPGIRRLLDFPEIPGLPDYMDHRHAREDFMAAAVWGDTPESFFILRKGKVERPATVVTGVPEGPMGVILTVDAEPMDAIDREYVREEAAGALSMLKGVRARTGDGKLVLELADPGPLPPERIGEALMAAIRHQFPRITSLGAEVILDPVRLAGMAEGIRSELVAERNAIDGATEEGVEDFITCTGCSPFAPDHVCIPTPEKPPQCGRPFAMIKTGALYGFDDMSNIHHRALHAGMNSFGTCPKGECLDADRGEWSGVNAAVGRLTGGRTRRMRLHSLAEFPPTGCGCFGFILFTMGAPRPGIGVMHRGYGGKSPDGRSWWDLHYALAGKQAPGSTGASAGYLKSRKFLQGDGGWGKVAWVSPKVAEAMGDSLPSGVEVGGPG